MRGQPNRQVKMLFGVGLDDLVPASHPLRRIRVIVDAVLRAMSAQFDELYGGTGRPSVPPEYLLKATLLMALYSIRSERQLCEQLRYNLLFKWFLDLNIEDEGWDHSTFSKNRGCVLSSEMASEFLAQVVLEAIRLKLLSSEHFTTDGTLIDAWASIKSFVPRDGQGTPKDGEDTPKDGEGTLKDGEGTLKDGAGTLKDGADTPKDGAERGRNPSRDFHGERRTNQTHVSRTDPDARMARKSYHQAASRAMPVTSSWRTATGSPWTPC